MHVDGIPAHGGRRGRVVLCSRTQRRAAIMDSLPRVYEHAIWIAPAHERHGRSEGTLAHRNGGGVPAIILDAFVPL
jgi:hypothetical protein